MRLIVENTLSEAESVIEPKPINALIDEARSQQINALINASDIMPFIGNDFLLSSVEGLLLQRIVLSEGLRLKNDKTCIEIPFFAGALGIGKTRNAVECIELVKKKNTPKLHEYLKNKVEIFMMVGKNGLKFGNFLFDNNEDLKVPLTTQLEQMITIRMCYQLCTYFFKSYFIESEWLGFKRVSQVTRFIQQCLDENRCTIVLVIDEFQVLMEYVDPITNRSGLDIVVKLLATVSSELARNDILFIPIFSGLATSSIQKSLQQSTYPQHSLQPAQNRVSCKDFIGFLQTFIQKFPDLATKHGLTKENCAIHPRLQKLFSKSYGTWRNVEKILNCLTTLTELEDIIFVRPSFLESNIVLDTIMSYFLTATPVSRNTILCNKGETIEYYEIQGLFTLKPTCTLEKNFIIEPFLPLTRLTYQDSKFNNFTTRADTVIEDHGIYRLYSTNLELFNTEYQVAKCHTYRQLGKTMVKFSEFFVGLLPTSKLLGSILWKAGYIELSSFNTGLEEISKTDPHSTTGVQYIFSHTQNKEGCDRITKCNILYEDGTKVETFILFQDRGMNWKRMDEVHTFSASDVATEITKNGQLVNAWQSIRLKNGTTIQHPTAVLMYMSTKDFTDRLAKEIQPTNQKEMQLDFEISNNSLGVKTKISEYPLMVLGNNRHDITNYSTSHYYGSVLYHGLYFIHIPKSINLCDCPLWIIEVLFNIYSKDTLKELKDHLQSCSTLEKVLDFEILDKNFVMNNITNNVQDENDRRIVVYFSKTLN